ncbi:MAG: hypothetical protein JW750_06290 [Anaerolineaceae bacterium]|nr:hypothetical protein [Anaerolineaceae bacterium]
MGKIVVLYGERQIGKTTFLMRLVEQFKAMGLDVGGVLSPPVFEGAEKTGIRARDVRGGEERLLAARNQTPKKDSATPGYQFDDAVLAWGNQCLAAAAPCDVLIVDELGPLELVRGAGWQAGIQAVESGAYRLAVVVIRESLHDYPRQHWQVSEYIAYQREDLTPRLLEFLED